MISVVVPLYNKKSSIKSTIESVLAQSYSDFELLVVDDGSTDGSTDVVKSFDDKRIRLISKENGGVSSARNEGIREAKSEFISFLDADDLWDKDFLLEINKLITDFPEAGIWGTSYSYKKNGGLIPAKKPLPELYRGYLNDNIWRYAHVYCSSAVCCRRNALLKYAMFDENIKFGEDIDVWWRIMLNYKAAYYNKSFAIYRFDEENRAMTEIIPLNKLYIYYFEKYKKYREENSDFRYFIDQECLWWLFPYYAENPKNKDVQRILKQIDLNEYKWSFRFRFKFPKLYKILKGLN